MVRAALAAVDAAQLVRQALATTDSERALYGVGAIDVVAAGKAAGPMLAAFAAAAPPRLRHVIGISWEPAPALPPGARWHTTVHPVPDERSVVAARDALDIATKADERDLLVVLLSGGASSIMALPADGLTLADKQETSRRLLSLGAEIHGLNAVRKHLSRIKGGQLAAAHAGPTLMYALSDVVGDDLSAIGSGPTVPDDTTFGDALAALDRYGGRNLYPHPIVERLARGAAGHIGETPKPGDPRLAHSAAMVIGASRTAIAGARRAAEALGYTVFTVEHPVVGEARVAARALLETARQVARHAHGARRVCIVAGGETTVRTSGSGKGGRNQEFALAIAGGLDQLGPAVAAASVGTDGIDGPTDAAGAIIDTSTLRRAQAMNLGPVERYLDEHNSYIFFDQLGDLIHTGPTGTNVGDLQVILIGSP